MADISLHEDSFSSWHTCPEDSKYNKDNIEHCKTTNESILKDLDLNLDNSEDESIVEFEKIVDQSDAFNKFKENNQNGDFLRPVTPTSSIRKENSPLIYPNLVRPKYLSDQYQQQNVSLADKSTPVNNINSKVVGSATDVPSIDVNHLNVPTQPPIQSSSITLVDTNNLEYDVSMPGGNISIFNNEEIHHVKDNLQDKKVGFKDSIKGKEEDNVKSNTTGKLQSGDVAGNSNENPGTFERIFSYFKSFGKSDPSTKKEDNNQNEAEKTIEDNNKNKSEKTIEEIKHEAKPVQLNKEKTLIETVEALGSPNSLFTPITPSLIPVDSTVTVVNDTEYDDDDDDDEDEFVNALDSAPVDVVDTNKNDNHTPNTRVNTIITPNNPTDIDIYGNEVVVEEKIVVQNLDGTESTVKKVIYTVDENGNKRPIETVVYDDNIEQEENGVYNNTIVPTTISNKPEIDDDVSISGSEDFVDAVTASHTNLNEEIVHQPSNVPPMANTFRDGTVKILNNNINNNNNDTDNKNLAKKKSNTTLKSTNSVNVELVPVNKPQHDIDVGNNNSNYFGFYEEDSSTTITEPVISKPSRKSRRKSKNNKKEKSKKRKWYNKIFRFSICNRNDDF